MAAAETGIKVRAWQLTGGSDWQWQQALVYAITTPALLLLLCRWGGPNDFFSGHMANGRRVVTDGKASTRHVVAGLAEALGGGCEAIPPGGREDENIFLVVSREVASLIAVLTAPA